MKQLIIIVAFVTLPLGLCGQPNCNAYLIYGDTLQYRACNLAAEVTKKHYQFSREYQEGMDEVLTICPYFAYAYREKASAYVKSGDFLTWKSLIDKAVEYDSLGYLGVRASLRYKFFADYSGAIKDIELLDSLIENDIGPSSNGTYHLNVVKGLCYKELGEKEKAIEVISSQIKTNSYIGAYDYLHLGVLYLESQRFDSAIKAFEQQAELNDLAENHFYLAIVYKLLDQIDRYMQELERSKVLYLEGSRMFDSYNQLIDEIDLEQINNEMVSANHKR